MGKSNYFDNVYINSYDFPVTPQSNFGFYPVRFSFLNKGSGIIQYSFDGKNVHGDLDPADQSKFMQFSNRSVGKVWFRAVSDFAVVRVEAWA